jgi:hypothetical protein
MYIPEPRILVFVVALLMVICVAFAIEVITAT